ncbi:MAG: ankyrin repeat domain-containing protein [Lachnospiraceae bacterium]|nr:ankyrin repeat domain-containing protein [Lachnospiraceae bacterium]
MINYNFINSEEELLHVIRTRTTTYEDYKSVVEKVQNINYTDSNDRSFLHEAVREKKLDVAVDLMQRGIDVNLQTINGYTAVRMTVSGEQWEMLEEILKYHPQINLKDWIYGESLLFDVVQYNSTMRNRIAKRLLERGANPYAQNKNGTSPLDLVIANHNEELIEAFQQIQKPLQEEPERFRVPKKRAGFFSVKIRDYKKFICTENTTIEYLKDKILDYATIAGGKKRKYKFKLVPIEESRWIIICCPDKMDFYNYHNLMSWIWGIPDDIKTPSQTICAAVHENDERLSYYAVMDKSKYGDARMVGRFQNGESFSIYLPEAYKKDGNARSYSDVLPIKRIDEYLDACGMDETWLEKATDMSGVDIEVEMAV